MGERYKGYIYIYIYRERERARERESGVVWEGMRRTRSISSHMLLTYGKLRFPITEGLTSGQGSMEVDSLTVRIQSLTESWKNLTIEEVVIEMHYPYFT